MHVNGLRIASRIVQLPDCKLFIQLMWLNNGRNCFQHFLLNVPITKSKLELVSFIAVGLHFDLWNRPMILINYHKFRSLKLWPTGNVMAMILALIVNTWKFNDFDSCSLQFELCYTVHFDGHSIEILFNPKTNFLISFNPFDIFPHIFYPCIESEKRKITMLRHLHPKFLENCIFPPCLYAH